MIPITPSAFRSLFCADFEPQAHHFTGPLIAQQLIGEGSVFPEEGRILASFAAKHAGPVLEIGSDLGISSRYIREGLDRSLTRRFPRLFCVDPFHKWDSQIYDERIEQFQTTADRFDPPEPCLWAFIDGDHRYKAVTADIRRCLELGIPHLFFHDTSPIIPPAVSASTGSDARRAVIDHLSDWTLYDIQTHCGLIYANCH